MAKSRRRPRMTRARSFISRRRPKRNEMKRIAKKAVIGSVAGLAVSIPLTILGQKYGSADLIEAGQRVGSIASAHLGGGVGNAGYQVADALFDRFVVMNGKSISGGSNEGYL